ncbi:MAG: glutamate racemase [bacterium]|nr:glutamate racemase [bacterium]
MKIGIFDSGVGGLSVAKAVRNKFPNLEVILREDKKNLPYGTKSADELLALVTPILLELVDQGCSVIVVACNTVTTTIIEKLREDIAIPLIGIEPMIKPAALITKTGVIAVFATPTTLASPRYKQLKNKYANGLTVIEPDCSKWSYMIENNRQDELNIQQNVELALKANADVIVLGCTHYHWIEKEILTFAASEAVVIHPEQAIIERLQSVISEL